MSSVLEGVSGEYLHGGVGPGKEGWCMMHRRDGVNGAAVPWKVPRENCRNANLLREKLLYCRPQRRGK